MERENSKICDQREGERQNCIRFANDWTNKFYLELDKNKPIVLDFG